jgi:hypothetical protein
MLDRQDAGVGAVMVVQELYRAVQRWTEDPNLLGIIGSWRDTQDEWNRSSLLSGMGHSVSPLGPSLLEEPFGAAVALRIGPI